MNPDLSDVAWRKSARSGGEGGNCVELAITTTVIGVRDSKNTSSVLVFTAASAGAFLAAARCDRLGF
jgi:hypothetical protein